MKKSELRQIIREEIKRTLKENPQPSSYESIFSGPTFGRNGETAELLASTLEKYAKAAHKLAQDGPSETMDLGSLVADIVELLRPYY